MSKNALSQDRMARVLDIHRDLKPLVAQLRRLQVGDYLSSKEFEHTLLENDWDAVWAACRTEIESTVNVFIMGYHDNTIEEDAFALMLNAAYVQTPDRWDILLSTFLKGYVAWKKVPVDIGPLGKSILSLETPIGEPFLKFLSEELKAKVPEDDPTKGQEKVRVQEVPELGNRIFVVHGHAAADLLKLEKMLKDEMGLDPIVVQNELNTTLESILNKIERLADECHAAIVMLTPDDKTVAGKRARQNVILELGYFLGRWWQNDVRRIIVLKKGAIETPSDIHGIEYWPYYNDPVELHLKLTKQLKAWGFKLKAGA